MPGARRHLQRDPLPLLRRRAHRARAARARGQCASAPRAPLHPHQLQLPCTTPAHAHTPGLTLWNAFAPCAGALVLLLAGALAAVPAAFLTTPADVVKTRLQQGGTKNVGKTRAGAAARMAQEDEATALSVLMQVAVED